MGREKGREGKDSGEEQASGSGAVCMLAPSYNALSGQGVPWPAAPLMPQHLRFFTPLPLSHTHFAGHATCFALY